jgi:hypothetical protein
MQLAAAKPSEENGTRHTATPHCCCVPAAQGLIAALLLIQLNTSLLEQQVARSTN